MWEAVYADGRTFFEYSNITQREAEFWGELSRPKYAELDRKLLVGLNVYAVFDPTTPVFRVTKDSQADILTCRRLKQKDWPVGVEESFGFRAGTARVVAGVVTACQMTIIDLAGNITSSTDSNIHLFDFEVS